MSLQLHNLLVLQTCIAPFTNDKSLGSLPCRGVSRVSVQKVNTDSVTRQTLAHGLIAWLRRVPGEILQRQISQGWGRRRSDLISSLYSVLEKNWPTVFKAVFFSHLTGWGGGEVVSEGVACSHNFFSFHSVNFLDSPLNALFLLSKSWK